MGSEFKLRVFFPINNKISTLVRPQQNHNRLIVQLHIYCIYKTFVDTKTKCYFHKIISVLTV